MYRMFAMMLTALAVVILPHVLAAEEPEKGPERPGHPVLFMRADGELEVTTPHAGMRPDPEMLFRRLDANHDGQVTLDEIPDRAPERLKVFLKRADKNDDKKLTPDELAEAVKKARELRKPVASHLPDVVRHPRRGHPGARQGPPRGPGHPPQARPAPWRHPGPPHARAPHGHGALHAWRGPHGRPGGPPHAGFGPYGRPGPPHAGFGPYGRPGPPHAGFGPHRGGGPVHPGPGPRLPNPEVVFTHLDKDKDKKLSVEEFTAGMRHLHRTMRPPRPMPPRPIAPHIRKPPHAAGKKPLGLLGAKLLKRADADKDGKITLNEVLEEQRERFKKLLDKADEDGDGALSVDEAKTVAAEVRKKAAEARK